MGNRFSRQNEGVEDLESTSNPYRYPQLLGKNFFADYFLMGGSRFETPGPDAYLFGENADLNLLNPKPVSFPYPQSPGNEPTKTLRSLVNLRKDSLKLVKSSDHKSYFIEFVFDADVKCSVTIHYKATEDLSTGLAIYTSREPFTSSPKSYFSKGSGQVYNSSAKHRIRPSLFEDGEVKSKTSVSHRVFSRDFMAAMVVAPRILQELNSILMLMFSFGNARPTATILGNVRHNRSSVFLQSVKSVGISNCSCHGFFGVLQLQEEEYDLEETGLECVICMSDMRDTLILPCRHLCLCRECAESLRYQANNCPICRSRKYEMHSGNENDEDTWPGYEEMPLVEALNGTIRPDDIPQEAIARMRRRSASSIRSSGRRRIDSARSQRCVERSLSACSGMSRPSTAAGRSRLERASSATDRRVESREAFSQGEARGDTENAAVDFLPRRDAEIEELKNSRRFEELTSAHSEEGATAPVLSSPKTQEDDSQDNQVHVDVSLPGTPLSSDLSGRSSRSAGSITATTPTYVRLEETTGEATVHIVST
ncbi:PREDICTED: E3 ubiquitin-protein ligase MGRN1-like [Acropora digitifera]|uniref:E3 ubiquitin-protein ligase MGRN1-like n=1 Tax=Acropora digitifera TaxID=70779 RepID=UPI00077A371F|nr:PREDICTED: E3 ubiquitin-protein ligase MGRN1-like [Acropora digitifera]